MTRPTTSPAALALKWGPLALFIVVRARRLIDLALDPFRHIGG